MLISLMTVERQISLYLPFLIQKGVSYLIVFCKIGGRFQILQLNPILHESKNPNSLQNQ